MFGDEDEYGQQVQRPDGSFFRLPTQIAQGLGALGGAAHRAIFQPPTPPMPPGNMGDTQGMPPQVPPMSPEVAQLGQLAGGAKGMFGPVMQAGIASQERFRQASLEKQELERQMAQAQARGMAPHEAASAQQAEQNFISREQERQDLASRAKDIQAKTRAWAQTEVDPFRVVHNAPTWGKIAMGLGMAINGFLNPRGPNHVMEAVFKLIDMDANAQEGNLRRQGQGIEMDRADQRSGEQDSARSFIEKEQHRLQLLELAQKQVGAEVSRAYGNKVAESNAKMLSSELEVKIAEVAAGLARAMSSYEVGMAQVGAQKYDTATKYKMHREDLGQHQADQAFNLAKDMTARAFANENTFVPVRNPYTGDAIGKAKPEQAKMMESFLFESKSAREALAKAAAANEALPWLAKIPGLNYYSDERAEVVRLLAKAEARLKNAYEFGAAVTGGEAKILTRITPEKPDDLFRKDPQKLIEAAYRDIDEEVETRTRAIFGTPITNWGQAGGSGGGGYAPSAPSTPGYISNDPRNY